jgi:hypothetical protein
MLKIIHKVNSIEKLKSTPVKYGVEIDIRAWKEKLVLNHEPFIGGEDLEEYLKHYNHAFVIFNIKETGIEQHVIDLAKKFNINDYFLLDVEFPFLYKAARRGFRKIAVRYSEDECIDTVLRYKNMIDWVWIDTNTKVPLDKKIIKDLSGLKTCLVSPEQWGRPQDIEKYKACMERLNFAPDAVMAEYDVIDNWD